MDDTLNLQGKHSMNLGARTPKREGGGGAARSIHKDWRCWSGG